MNGFMYRGIASIKHFFPKPLWRPIKKIILFGLKHYCPVWKSRVRNFVTYKELSLPNFVCPVCYSFERHRLALIFFGQRTGLLDSSSKRMLHIAPEEGLQDRFKKIANLKYFTGDLNDPSVMVKINVGELPYTENSFDVIYCSHVLEHIQDDRKAIRELNRVLKFGGHAVFQVPIANEKTFEDPSITEPAQRKRLFGQSDQVRSYGPDFKIRLEETGFNVQVFSAEEIVRPKDLYRMGIPVSEVIFFCSK
jgi:SAM-dependent methyltransferase